MGKMYTVSITLIGANHFKFMLIHGNMDYPCILPIANLIEKGYQEKEITNGLEISYKMKGKKIDIQPKK